MTYLMSYATVHGAPFFISPRFPDCRVVLSSLHLSMASLSGYQRHDFMIQIEHLTSHRTPEICREPH